ncbi:hypothetical protein PHYBOEH_000339 [Phytophthora boehmeriae]|uniref:RxLR effector protein n=1 Tax=Phytophthora boehmeriae TaxID=109152 RepID=A0A8T1VGB2_9STRA|nr:hypothetical protein PHYBOEH_000339 [Phytophthora boehmeriae]
MRLHYVLLVAAATLLAATEAFSASTQTNLAAATTADSTATARQLAAAFNEGNAIRFLRTMNTADEDDDDDDDDDEERGITILSASTTAKQLRKWLKSNSVISKETSQYLKASGFSADDIASMYAKYVKLG